MIDLRRHRFRNRRSEVKWGTGQQQPRNLSTATRRLLLPVVREQVAAWVAWVVEGWQVSKLADDECHDPAPMASRRTRRQLRPIRRAGPARDWRWAIPVAPSLGKYWALQGLSGLSIKIDESGESVAFHSLGNQPELDVTVFQQNRMEWFAWAVALAIVVAGLLMANASLALVPS